ncbi:DEAD/DEAH box helicase [Arcanobacterium haemolyticum]|uniref:DEAD/DEAH box helicase n=1 Tax=Arcanobacterium haemolyticum TaxID=28264 RepID=UPI000D8BFBB8|nr:DEAD/DEAH box helicase [Arcanobacterium haemolyticum]QCX46920.1 DEAD/DEAH box helicase [Arcanobacterium haemolyticum]SPT75159.1 DNA phosphorothioation system restriction enzyme [Arcanobacterium haemolyticum]
MSPELKGSAHPPQSVSVSAAENLPPVFPQRAAWGTAGSLRAWQAAALEQFMHSMPADFLAVATPGAGKTTFALRVATELMARREVNEIVVVAPTEHLKYQWAEAAARVGLQLDPDFSNSNLGLGESFNGACVTYAQVARAPMFHRQRIASRKTLVILDEVHHGGDNLSWGDAIRAAFSVAKHRLSLTGTPFRSDTSAIPFVTYEPDEDGIYRSKADYTYGYAEALRDFVVRPVMFMSYTGNMQWQTKHGEIMDATLGEPLTKDLIAQAWRTALDPSGEWIQSVLKAADERLSVVRRSVPDAGGLVIATDHKTARAYAEILDRITSKKTTVVLSDDATASDKIAEFSAGTSRWMVAVRMVSEGVDVPRLCVGVYATSASTPLFFAQAIGRFVRSRKRGETASVFLPSVPRLLGLAGELEAQRDHALSKPSSEQGWDDESLAEANREEKASDELEGPGYRALSAAATFDKVVFDGDDFGSWAEVGSDEEADFLGIPGLLEPDDVATLLRQHQQDQQSKAAKKPAGGPAPVMNSRKRREKRQELSKIVAAYSAKTGRAHALIHTDLRNACGGPEVARASLEQIEARIAQLQKWFVGRK